MTAPFEATSLAPLPGDDEDPALLPLRLLVAEPDGETAAWLANILRGRGYEVELVVSEEQILGELTGGNYDVVLVAWQLEDATGLSALRRIRACFAMPDLPVTLIAPGGEVGDVVQAFDRGANDVLQKPLDPDVTRVRIHNLVALRRARLALRRQAMIDELTKVYNRAYMMQALSAQVAQAARYDRPLSFCLCDVDHFKLVNDRYGHRMGDAALRTFAQALRRRLRRADIVGRFGGDEFCAILPETSAEDARWALDEVRLAVAQAPIELARVDGVCRISASFGIADMTMGQTDGAGLIHAADEALYLAKARGRNRVAIYEPPCSGRAGKGKVTGHPQDAHRGFTLRCIPSVVPAVGG